MRADELKRWAAAAPPGTMVPAEQIAAMEVEPAALPAATSSSEYLPVEGWIERKLGAGVVQPRTVARWCRAGKIEGARQLPDGTWVVPSASDPPARAKPGDAGETTKPHPVGRDGALSLVEIARRRTRQAR